MEKLWIFPVLAVVVEALTEYIKNIITAESWKRILIQAGALALGVVTCLAASADLFDALGIGFGIPRMGCVFTGVFVSRGANYVSDLLKTISGGRSQEEEQA